MFFFANDDALYLLLHLSHFDRQDYGHLLVDLSFFLGLAIADLLEDVAGQVRFRGIIFVDVKVRSSSSSRVSSLMGANSVSGTLNLTILDQRYVTFSIPGRAEIPEKCRADRTSSCLGLYSCSWQSNS